MLIVFSPEYIDKFKILAVSCLKLKSSGTLTRLVVCMQIILSFYALFVVVLFCRQLRVSGQRVGASAVLCHMKRIDKSSKKFSLQIANVGDVEAVLCRQDDAVVLTRKFTTIENREECYRVCLSDGIIMEVIITFNSSCS